MKITKSQLKQIIKEELEAVYEQTYVSGKGPADIARSTMNIEKRKLIKINLKHGAKEEKKTEKLFESLMGKNPGSRFKFIQENANFTSNLDI